MAAAARRVITNTSARAPRGFPRAGLRRVLCRRADARSLTTTREIDGDSIETDFAYDAADRRTAMTFPSDTAENTTYSYDATGGGNVGVGRLTGVSEQSGSTSFTYDAQGRLIADARVISPGGYTSALTAQYAYDANGRVTQVTYPSGDIATYTRTTDGLVTGVTMTPSGGSPQAIASGVSYEPYGPLAGLTYGNGLILSRTYDQDYQLTSLTVAPSGGPAVINLTFGWQADGRLASSADGVGNRTPTTTTATLLKASVASGSNQVTGTTTLAGTTARTLSYTPGGLLTQDIRAGATTYGYAYNAARRLVSVTQGGSAAGNYAYDFAGQRVWRQTFGSGAAQTAYVHDRNGHLLAEHDAVTGAVRREYVWIDDMPVALADISGSTVTVSYIHTGQIDEPLEVTSAAQAVVWNGYVDPFGNGSTFATPTLNPGIDMRLPGQSLQLETGSLSQNRYRDYDPSLGRYIEADPLGIEAGQNLYAYVDGNPLNDEDPWGLWRCARGASCAGLSNEVRDSLSCMDRCSGRDVVVTCGTNGHGPADPHSHGNAIDLGHNANPGLSIATTGTCFQQCFSANSRGNPELNSAAPAGGYHYHIQTTPGPYGQTGWDDAIHAHNH